MADFQPVGGSAGCSKTKREKVQKTMKKFISGMIGLALMAGLTGCDMNKDQITAVCQTAGTAAALGWISYDNPTDAQKAQVIEVLAVVQSSIAGVGTNTYVATLFPLVQDYVAKSDKIKPVDKPMVLAGCLAVLSGIDIMFNANPKWKADTDQVASYVNAFITGANSILVLPCTDDTCSPAVEHFNARAGLKRK